MQTPKDGRNGLCTLYKSLSILLQDFLIAYIKPELQCAEHKRKVLFDEASRATKYRRVSDMHSLVCNHLLTDDIQNIADEIALLARQFLNAVQKQMLSGVDDHADLFEDEESAEVATNPNDTATMSMEQNKRYILINSMKNQRRVFNLKEKILVVQLFQIYYDKDLGLFTRAKNTNTDIDRYTTIDTIYNGVLDKAYTDLKTINIYKAISKRQYKRWCLNNGSGKVVPA